jgi:hypothetical protein
MSTLGFTRGAGGPRAHIRVPMPPQSERLQKFVAAQTQKYREDKAVEAALAKDTAVAPVPEPTTMSVAAPRLPIQAQMGGIEAKVAAAETRANAAHSLAASIRSEFTKHAAATEQRAEAAKARLAELDKEVQALRAATRDAWMATFWMYADVVQNAAVMDAPPPRGKLVWLLEAPATAVLFGEMVQTPEGPAMQCRWVDPEVGQLSSGWMLLRTAGGQRVLHNFRLQY